MSPAYRQPGYPSRLRLRALPTFRGPRDTLILFDPWLEMWLVAGWDGGEVLVPEADLAAFLEHCRKHLPPDPPPQAASKETENEAEERPTHPTETERRSAPRR